MDYRIFSFLGTSMENFVKTIKFWYWERKHPVSKSRHLKDYEEIALRHDIEVRRVYHLAHGYRSQTHNESRAVDELIQRGILR